MARNSVRHEKKKLVAMIVRSYTRDLPRKAKKKVLTEMRKNGLSFRRLMKLRWYQIGSILQSVGRSKRTLASPLWHNAEYVRMHVSLGLGKTGTPNRDLPKVHKCEHCGREMKPCPGKLHATGERSYVGLFPCACKHPIMTDCGVVYPGDEEHDILLKSGNYSINDLLTPVS